MKPQTAANKLGIYLPAAPEAFQRDPISREEIDALRAEPPEWLVELRRIGPFPRDVTAQKLGISRRGLARAGVGDALDSTQIGELLSDPPDWLISERESYTAVVAEKERVRSKQQGKGS